MVSNEHLKRIGITPAGEVNDGGFMNQASGCLGKLILLLILLAVVLSIFTNAIDIRIIKYYGLKQFFLNMWHLHQPIYYQLDKKVSINGYEKIIPIDKLQEVKPQIILKKGNVFLMNGYQTKGEYSWLAAEVYEGDEKLTFWIPVQEKWKRVWATDNYNNKNFVQYNKSKLIDELDEMVADALLQNIEFIIVPKTDKIRIKEMKNNADYELVPKEVYVIQHLWNKIFDKNHNHWGDKSKKYFAPKTSKKLRKKIEKYYFSKKVRNMYIAQLKKNFEIPKM